MTDSARRAYYRRWRQKNRLHLQDYLGRTKDHRVMVERKRDLMKLYGLRLDQYETMWYGQGGVCALCLRPEKQRRLAVDHDHKTGRVRGLLCWWCNNKVLAYRNTAEMFQRAVEYLRSTFDGRLLPEPLTEGR